LLNQFKRLGGDSLLYALMNVGTKIIAFIMLPLYTQFLPDPAQYGMLDYLDRITSMLTFVVIFGTDSALAFYYFDTKDEQKKLKYVQNVMSFRLAVVILIFLCILLGGSRLSNLLLDNDKYVNLLYISAGTLLLDTIVTFVTTVLRYEFKTVKVVLITVLRMLLVAVFSYIFLKYIMTSIKGILIGRIIAAAIVLPLLGRKAFSFIRFHWDRNVMKELLAYAAPLVPASIAFWVIVNASSFLLKEFTSFTEVGIYGTAMRFATLITLLTSGVQMAWRPYSMSLKDKKNSKRIFAKLYMGILLIGTFGVLAVATIMPYVIRLLSEKYYISYQYVAPISAVTFLNFYYMIISVGIFFNKQTKHISIAFTAAAVISIVLNLVFIPLFSIWGTVAAYLISYVFAIVMIFKKSQKSYYVPVSLAKMSFLFGTMFIAVISMIYVQTHHLSWFYIVIAWVFYFAMVAVSRVDRDLFAGKRTIEQGD
jgi:O-antigen/teichoic acid export membrane protein